MKRYVLVDQPNRLAKMVESPVGAWVSCLEAEARIAELEAVLREVAHGEMLDGVGNRNDNGLQDFQNWPASGKQITAWLRKIETVLEPK